MAGLSEPRAELIEHWRDGHQLADGALLDGVESSGRGGGHGRPGYGPDVLTPGLRVCRAARAYDRGMPRHPAAASGRRGHLPASARRLRKVEETSAGGLVVDRSAADSRGALIARVNRRGQLEWVLPKGHLEAGETAQDAAVREVREETGLQARILAPLGSIDYWFVADGRRIHKVVHHFLLEAVGGELSDADIEVTEVAWIPFPELATRLRYDSERRLLDRVPELLASTP